MENQEEVATVHAKFPSYLKESCGLLCETRTNFRPLFQFLCHKFPPLSQRRSHLESLFQYPAPGMSSLSSWSTHRNTRAREVPAAEGLLPFSRLLFLSFPFGIHVSMDGMADTDSGWRSLPSKIRLILFHDF